MHDRTTSHTPRQGADGWHKSSYSGTPQENCVEQGVSYDGLIAVRDSKENGRGAVLRIEPAAWRGFIGAVKGGEFPIEL
ncbi:DUF397 domain-containing protein [Kitasatospora viridis]|uniref:Uncharacterized protein DUF397 n=1 Tax=Kitasatospora viridis TaxID=281105 RepID=A0A561UMT4_9ACTN|nr:DUF397 domain-containing protein [Kitasatospora viridis]TWG00676.1 uncharacterized protein DUF397 [Kitasatospora viridis]